MKHTFIIILIFLLNIPLYSQEHTHPMRIYTDSNGKIYVNLHQPLYFKISTSASSDSHKYLLNSHATPSVVNPLYFRHEGRNVVYTPWAVDTATRKPIYPRVNVNFIVYADGTAPLTKIKLTRPGILFNDTLYFSGGLKISFIAKDNLSGVDSIFYSIDHQQFKSYKDTLSFSQQKLYTLRYYSVDNVGNVEKPHIYVFKIDNSAPLSNFKVVGIRKGDVLSPRAKIKIEAKDQFTKVKKIIYSLDDETGHSYTGPIQLFSLPEGWHTLHYYAVDIMGNRTDTVNYKFFLDKTPPLILEEIVGNSYFVNGTRYLSGNSKLKLTAVDNYAGVKSVYYSFDGKQWHKYTGLIPFPKTQKTFKLMYYAVDSVDNKSDINVSMAQSGGNLAPMFMDLTPPKITYSLDNYYKYGDTVFINSKTKIKIVGTDKESGLKEIFYQVDNDSVKSYKMPFSIAQEGRHKVTITAQDNVNNISFKVFSVAVDTTPPEINFVFSIHPYKLDDKLMAYPRNVKIFVTARDKSVGVRSLYVSVNNGSLRPWQNALIGFAQGENIVKVIAVDYLGNKSVKSIKFIVK